MKELANVPAAFLILILGIRLADVINLPDKFKKRFTRNLIGELRAAVFLTTNPARCCFDFECFHIVFWF